MRDLTPGDFDAPAFSLGGPPDYAFSPDGKELAFASNHDPDPASSTNCDIWTVAVDASAEELKAPRSLTAANRAWDGTPRYSPDGRYLGYRTQKVPGYESDRFRLALYDRGTRTTRVLTEGLTGPLQAAAQPADRPAARALGGGAWIGSAESSPASGI